jgi:hypothetical protein
MHHQFAIARTLREIVDALRHERPIPAAGACERCGRRGDDVRFAHADLWCDRHQSGCTLCAACDAAEYVRT